MGQCHETRRSRFAQNMGSEQRSWRQLLNSPYSNSHCESPLCFDPLEEMAEERTLQEFVEARVCESFMGMWVVERSVLSAGLRPIRDDG